MSLTQKKIKISENEYLEIEKKSKEKHEFYKGECFAMAGASRKHNILSLKLMTLLKLIVLNFHAISLNYILLYYNERKAMGSLQIKSIIYLYLFILIFFIAGCITQVEYIPEKTTTKQNQIKQPSQPPPCHLTENKPRPSWIDNPPQNSQYLFGIGVAPKQSPVSNQIQAARILAMRDISQQIQVHVKSLFQEKLKTSNSESDINITSSTELKAEALLRGVKIVDQWNDTSACNIYMLASVALDISHESPNRKSETQQLQQTDKGISLNKKGFISNIQADGSCVIQGISPRQAQTIALQRARATAIEKASGIEIRASKVVSDGTLVLDLIRSYSKGYIVNEKVKWQPVNQYQKNSESPPVVQYNVSIVADIFLPEKKPDKTGLSAKLNKSLFTSGERAILRIETRKACQVAVFNIQANDKVVMLHPHPMRPLKTLIPNHPLKMDNLFPEPLPGEKHNVEALFICATIEDIDFQILFPVDESMIFSEFFKKYSSIASDCVDMIIPYEVVSSF